MTLNDKLSCGLKSSNGFVKNREYVQKPAVLLPLNVDYIQQACFLKKWDYVPPRALLFV